MKTLNTLKQLMEVQRDLLTETFWQELIESQLWTDSPLGKVLSDVEYWEGGSAEKNGWDDGFGTYYEVFSVGGDNGYKEYEWQEVLEFVRTSK